MNSSLTPTMKSPPKNLTRRLFITTATASSLVGSLAKPAHGTTHNERTPSLPPTNQGDLSEDHIIWGYDRNTWNYDGIMQGSPPSLENSVFGTPAATFSLQGKHMHAVWTAQHNREQSKTQDIRRATVPSKLELRPMDLRTFDIPDGEGGKTSLRHYLASTNTDAFAVFHVKDGINYLVYEQYNNGMNRQQPHQWYSVSKVALSLLTGVLVGQNKLRLDHFVSDIVPELNGTAFEKVTLRQLLDMQSGIDWGLDPKELTTEMQNRLIGLPERSQRQGAAMLIMNQSLQSRTGGFYDFIRTLKRSHAPGLFYQYNDADPMALQWAITRTVQKRYSLALQDLLWKPLGCSENAYIVHDYFDTALVGAGMSSTLLDVGRLGLLVVNKGKVDSERLIPESFINDIMDFQMPPEKWQHPNSLHLPEDYHSSDVGYRSYFILGADKQISGRGLAGQYLVIQPRFQTVIVKFSMMDLNTINRPVYESGREVFVMNELAKKVAEEF
jgi:CubicO group peptidase (beta-lactamase class C family)